VDAVQVFDADFARRDFAQRDPPSACRAWSDVPCRPWASWARYVAASVNWKTLGIFEAIFDGDACHGFL
jgi:hypothetical protein